MSQRNDSSWQDIPNASTPEAVVQSALKGIHYPASKQDLIKTAQSNNAPETILSKVRALPDQEYSGPQDVQRQFGKF